MNGDFTVYDTLDRVAVGDIRTRLRDILGAFLFRGEDIDKKVKVLSGGERSRLAMARLMLEPYNLLILDEPTNHMDMRSKDILKTALQKFDGTVVVVSHDREFLDGIVDKVYEFTFRYGYAICAVGVVDEGEAHAATLEVENVVLGVVYTVGIYSRMCYVSAVKLLDGCLYASRHAVAAVVVGQ